LTIFFPAFCRAVRFEVKTRTLPFAELQKSWDIAAAVERGARPPVGDAPAPAGYDALMVACWAAAPDQRPPAAAVVVAMIDPRPFLFPARGVPRVMRWPGWQVRRPLLEGDPRSLLAAFEAGQPRWMVSTALETGIGRRWVDHLAALQALGPTPTAPGLAPGWCPQGDLFSADPQLVWQAAA
jgi:hypothetical protein